MVRNITNYSDSAEHVSVNIMDAPVKIGRFRIIELIGYGSMAHVYRARDLTLKRDVALKLLPERIRVGERTISLEQLIVEARSAAQLDHPNIVRIYEIGRHEGLFYIAMELLEGASLIELIDSAGKVDAVRACQLVADVAEALTYAHNHGVIHRDIKPGNLMLTRAGRCRLIDFGLAKVIEFGDDLGSGTEIVGTPYYIAPEVIRGSRATEQSDIYSLGATLWHLITGEPPFVGRNPREVMMMHLSEPLPLLVFDQLAPDAPDKLKKALQIALAKNPADRFQSAKKFAQILRRLTIPGNDSLTTMQQLSINHDNATPIFALREPRRNNLRDFPLTWLMVGAGAAVLLVVVGILISSVFSGGGSNQPSQPTSEFAQQATPIVTSPPAATVPVPVDQQHTEPASKPAAATDAQAALLPSSQAPSSKAQPQPTIETLVVSTPEPAPQSDPTSSPTPLIDPAEQPAEPSPIVEPEPVPEPEPVLDLFLAYEQRGAIRAFDHETLSKLVKDGNQRPQTIVGRVTNASVTSTGKTFRVRLDDANGFYAVAFPGTFRALGQKFGGANGEGLHGKAVSITGKVSSYRGTPQIIIERPDQIRILKDIDQSP